MLFATSFIMPRFIPRRSSRSIPGFLGIPAVMIKTSVSFVSFQSDVPIILESYPSCGRSCIRSSAFPLTIPSALGISNKTTSPNSFWAAISARLPPIWPPPINVIFLRPMCYLICSHCDNFSITPFPSKTNYSICSCK